MSYESPSVTKTRIPVKSEYYKFFTYAILKYSKHLWVKEKLTVTQRLPDNLYNKNKKEDLPSLRKNGAKEQTWGPNIEYLLKNKRIPQNKIAGVQDHDLRGIQLGKADFGTCRHKENALISLFSIYFFIIIYLY